MRAPAKTRHQSGEALTVSGRTRFAPSAIQHSQHAERGEHARSTRLFGAIHIGSLYGHPREATSPSRRPSHHMACMRCRLSPCARVLCRRSLHRRASSQDGCWTLLDILLDASEPRVPARGAERSVESARRVASVCRHGLRAVIVATWSAVGVGVRRTLATVRLQWTLMVLISHMGCKKHRWCECRELCTCVYVK